MATATIIAENVSNGQNRIRETPNVYVASGMSLWYCFRRFAWLDRCRSTGVLQELSAPV